MYDKGVLEFRYRKGKLVKRYQSSKGEEGEERKYEAINIRGKRKHKGKIKMEIKENARTFGGDDDENEK